MFDIDAIVSHYIASMLWGDTDDDGEPLEDTHDCDDMAAPALDQIRAQVADFVKANRDDLAGMAESQIGHDFYLTRNGHGVGFWDRGLGARGDRLTDSAHRYGESSAYIGDNGLLYVS